MHSIEWKEEFSIGNNEIDSQHKRLISLLNELLEAENLHVRSNVISKALYKLIDYANEHFSMEEKFMIEIDFPRLQEHKKEHYYFKKMATQFCMETVDRQKDVPHEIITFLAEWTVSHVMYSDQEIKRFLAEVKV